jgi:hypothetical protein
MIDDESYQQFEKLDIKRRLIYVVAFYTLGCIFYMSNEDWTLIDAIYFITVTITSVGYGDLEVSNSVTQYFTCILCIHHSTLYSWGMNVECVSQVAPRVGALQLCMPSSD